MPEERICRVLFLDVIINIFILGGGVQRGGGLGWGISPRSVPMPTDLRICLIVQSLVTDLIMKDEFHDRQTR